MHTRHCLWLLCSTLAMGAALTGCFTGEDAPNAPPPRTVDLLATWIQRADAGSETFWRIAYRFPDSTTLITTQPRTDSTGRSTVRNDTIHLAFDPLWKDFHFENQGQRGSLVARIDAGRLCLIFGESGSKSYQRVSGNPDPTHPWEGSWRSMQCGSHSCDFDTLEFSASGVFKHRMGPKFTVPDQRFVEAHGLIRVLQTDSVVQTMAPLFSGDSIKFVHPGFSCSMDGVCLPKEPLLLEPIIPE